MIKSNLKFAPLNQVTLGTQLGSHLKHTIKISPIKNHEFWSTYS